jgi:putative heme-binding domain-containing protein
MRRSPKIIAIILLAGTIGPGRTEGQQPQYGPELVARTEALAPAEERSKIHLPPGFDIQLVAAEPDIHKPLNIAFDERGRLWVTDTVEYPYPAKPGAKTRDTVKILADFGDDGRARSITTFADNLNIPIGILPLPDGALVHSIPYIYHLIDSDGDGKADRREVYYREIGFRDTHGMTNSFSWGFDGWIYACHGFSNDSTLRGSDEQAVTMNSGNTYRMKPDGSHVEQWTHGQVNPFGLCFDPLGNLYSADCHSKPVYMLLRGAYYPSFGKPDDGLGFGPEMVQHDHGSTAIAGVVNYSAEEFPEEYRGTVFIGNVVTNRLNHDTVEWHGSSPKGILQPDFLVSDDPWFRPVYTIQGPDGALYIADFYNRIIGHYEVPLTHPGRDRERGRIWRVVYRGKDGKGLVPKAPFNGDFTKAGVDQLVDLLAHPNLTVRTFAANRLVRLAAPAPGFPGDTAIVLLAKAFNHPKNNHQRVHALWILQRHGILDDATIQRAAKDDSREVRVHAMRVLSERPRLDKTLDDLALAGLKDADPFVRRAAAESLGQHPARGHIRPLLALRHEAPKEDEQLVHMTRIALRNQLLPADNWQEVTRVRLDEEDARAIADVAVGVPSVESGRFLLHYLRTYDEPTGPKSRYLRHIARTGALDLIALVAEFVGHGKGTPLDRAAFLRELCLGAKERPAAFVFSHSAQAADRRAVADLIRELLASSKGEEVQAGIELTALLPFVKEARDEVAALALSSKTPEVRRQAALRALAEADAPGQVATFAKVLNDATAPTDVRARAAEGLARANTPPARTALVDALPTAASQVQTSIAANLASSPAGARALVESIEKGKASARLLQDRGIAFRIAAHKLPDIKEKLESLTRGLPAADRRLDDLIARRRTFFATAKADPARGAKVFEKNCATCHQLDGKGAKVGPQLDGVGLRGLDRLLEDTLDPSRNVDQYFRTTLLALDDGQSVSGLLLREEGNVLVLADSQGKEVRVDRSKVDQRAVSPLSPMPANLAEQISEADFADLLSFLLAKKPPTDSGPRAKP